jgi:hypothetical protein
MQFQTELHQPLLKITQESFGVSPVLKAQHNVVGISDNYDIACGFRRCEWTVPTRCE